jgi:putative ABC transport system permease protein
MALGAGRSNILAVVCAHGMGAATVGVALGVCGALAAGRLLATFLFGVKSTDAWTLAAVAILALVAAALASFVPARRATQLDPMAALRYE